MLMFGGGLTVDVIVIMESALNLISWNGLVIMYSPNLGSATYAASEQQSVWMTITILSYSRKTTPSKSYSDVH